MSADAPDFFIGWRDRLARPDRRFLLAAAAGFLAGAGGLSALLAADRTALGTGTWDPGADRDWPGLLVHTPYPHLVTTAIEGTRRSALLFCQVKCGVRPRVDDIPAGPVRVRGSLLRHGSDCAIAVIDGPDAFAPLPDAAVPEAAQPVPLGDVTLVGEILDSKCWLGAMRPGFGKVHKACAALCIQGGIPPAFRVRDRSGQERLLLLTDPQGGAAGPGILPFVADPVRASGRLARQGDLITFAVAPETLVRL